MGSYASLEDVNARQPIKLDQQRRAFQKNLLYHTIIATVIAQITYLLQASRYEIINRKWQLLRSFGR